MDSSAISIIESVKMVFHATSSSLPELGLKNPHVGRKGRISLLFFEKFFYKIFTFLLVYFANVTFCYSRILLSEIAIGNPYNRKSFGVS